METHYYKIVGLAPGLDGLIVLGEPEGDDEAYVAVRKIINSNVVFGDREMTILLPDYGMLINLVYLKRIDYERREYSHSNPFGKYLDSKTYEEDGLRIAVASYEKTTSVTVLSGGRTKWAGHFPPGVDVQKMIEDEEDLLDAYVRLKSWQPQE